MSVWQNMDSLRRYAFCSKHVQVLSRRSEWTEFVPTSSAGPWWIADDASMPSVDDATVQFYAFNDADNSISVLTLADSQA